VRLFRTLYQAAHRLSVVGLLASGLEAKSPHLIGFSKGLSEAGFVEGRNVGIQYRFAEGHYDRLPARIFGILINPTNDNAENQMKDIAKPPNRSF
jgi:hypothetical protein